MTNPAWSVSGSYFEACNCDPICPCRSVGGRPGGKSTHGECLGTLSWLITQGHAGEIDLAGLAVVMNIRYTDATQHDSPWDVVLYVDERASPEQHQALADIFLGRVGGTPLRNFAAAIGEVHAVRPARIELDHTPGRQRIGVKRGAKHYVRVRAARPFADDHSADDHSADGPSAGDTPVMCGIPGFDHPGTEYHTAVLQSEEVPPLAWDLVDVCGFATDFAYSA